MATPWVGYDTLNQARWLPELADGHLEFENLLVAVAVAVAVAGVVVGCDWVTMRGRSRHWVAVSLGLGAIVGSLVLCAAVPAGGVWVMYADAAGRMGELVLQPARHIGQYLFVAAGRQRC